MVLNDRNYNTVIDVFDEVDRGINSQDIIL